MQSAPQSWQALLRLESSQVERLLSRLMHARAASARWHLCLHCAPRCKQAVIRLHTLSQADAPSKMNRQGAARTYRTFLS